MSALDERDLRIAGWMHREAPAAMDEAVLREIVERTRATPQRPGGWWARGLAMAGPTLGTTVAVAAIALIVLVVIRPPSDEGRPIGSAPVGSSAMPLHSPEPSTSPSATAAPERWSAIGLPDPRPEDVQGEIPNDVVAGGPGFVAVGRSYPSGDMAFDERQLTPAIWTSVDGAIWELAADLAALGPAELRAVASGPDGWLLAVGSDMRGIGPDEEPPTGVGMWRSSDGIRWEAAPAPDGANFFMDVIGTDEGWLVAGWGESGGPTIFTSNDLETWTATRLPGGSEDQLNGVFGDGSGRALAFGCDHPADDERGLRAGCERPMGWLRDGEAWEAVELPTLPVAGAVLGDRLVIIGPGEAGAASFSSRDGRSWVPGDVLPGEAFVSAMTVTDDGLAAAGTIEVNGERFMPAVWLSADGQRWESPAILPVEGSPQEPTVTAIIDTPAGLVGLGYAFYDKAVAQGWIRSP